MNTQTICGAFVYGLFYLISLLPNALGAIDPAPPIVPAVAPTNTVDIRNYMYTDYIKVSQLSLSVHHSELIL
jgi:hypothetical protein